MVLRQALAIARHEFLCHLATSRVRVLLGIMVIVSPLMAYVGLQGYRNRSSDYDRLQHQRVLDRQGDRKPIAGFQSDRSLRVSRPPSSLSILVRGVEGQLPPYWDMSPAGPSAGQPASGAGIQERNATLDIEFLLRVLMGFLAVTLGAEMVALDRQRGTLKVLFSQPLPGHSIAFAKLLSGTGVLLLGVLTIWATTLGVLSVTARDLLSAEFVGTSAGLMLMGLIYLITLLATGMIIGQRSRSYYSANVTATLTWLVISFVLIPGMAFVARLVTQPTDRSSFEAARDERFAAVTRAAEEQLGARLRDLIGPTGDPRTVTIQSAVGAEIDRLWTEKMAAAQGEIAELTKMVSQKQTLMERWTRALATVNPAALLQEASADLSGTGTTAARRLEGAVARYQLELDKAVFGNRPRIHLRVPSDRGVSLDVIERRPVPTVGELPSFNEGKPGWATRLKDSLDMLAVLLGYALLASTLTCATFRYTPSGTFRVP